MGVLVGLLLGSGLFLMVAGRPSSADRGRPRPGLASRTRLLLVQAGIPNLSPTALLALSVSAGLGTGLLALALTGTFSLAVAFAGFGAVLPQAWVRRRAATRRIERRELWPHVVDDLSSGVRAGLSLPEALAALGERGPEPLRPAFVRFADGYRATGSFGRCLDRLADDLADPVADRLVEALRLTRDVGGTDLGRLLRTLSQFLRDDARTRAELEARQSWTVQGARLALVAPWAVLLLLAVHGTTVRAYDRPVGVLILVLGGAASFAAYAIMRRVGRLPEDRRVLRAAHGPPAAEPGR
jgi:tight adherence protein B